MPPDRPVGGNRRQPFRSPSLAGQLAPSTRLGGQSRQPAFLASFGERDEQDRWAELKTKKFFTVVAVGRKADDRFRRIRRKVLLGIGLWHFVPRLRRPHEAISTERNATEINAFRRYAPETD